MNWLYQLVSVRIVASRIAEGWEVAGQDRRYPSHVWMRMEA